MHVGSYFILAYFPRPEKKAYSLLACLQIIYSVFTVPRMGIRLVYESHAAPQRGNNVNEAKGAKMRKWPFLFSRLTPPPNTSESMFRSFSQIITISYTLCYLMEIFYSMIFNSFMHYPLEIGNSSQLF